MALLALTLLLAAAPVKIPVAAHPCGASAGFGSVWVASDTGTVSRLDQRTGAVRRRVRVAAGGCSVATGAGAVWVTNYRTGSVLRIDPATLRVRSIRTGPTTNEVIVAGGLVWSTTWDAGELVAIDPRSQRVARRVQVGPHPAGLRALGGAIWVGFGRDTTDVARFDPATAELERVDVGARSPSGFAMGTRDLWIVADGNLLIQLDPASRTVLGSQRLGRTLAQPAAAPDGTIWVPDKELDTIFRVDPRTGQAIDRLPGGDGAYHALRAFGSMWVTSYAGADVWRFRDP